MLGWPNPKQFWSQSRSPLPTDDISVGAEQGSSWLDTTSLTYFICFSNARGAALWHQFCACGSPPVLPGTADPILLGGAGQAGGLSTVGVVTAL